MTWSRRTARVTCGLGLAVMMACGPADPAADGGAPEAPAGEPMSGGTPAEEASGPTAVNERFAGTWELVRVERFDENDELLPAPEGTSFGADGTVGYITYDPAGYMGVVIMGPDRMPYSEDGPTPDEARAAMASYTSYFGPFTVDEAEGVVTHHLVASDSPGSGGRDNRRGYEFHDDQLTLRPPRGDSGIQLALTWQRVPDAMLTPAEQQFVGFWRIRDVERRNAAGDTEEVGQYAHGYIIYTAAGHMQVHLERPDRPPYAGEAPTDEEILAAARTYVSYFGPFSVDETEQVVTHERIGSTRPTEGRPSPLERNYEFRDNLLVLSPVPDDPDVEFRTYLNWERISED